MSTTTAVAGIAVRKGAAGQDSTLHILEVGVRVTGTYATASKPHFDLAAALEEARKVGITSVSVKSVTLVRDGNDGTDRYTIPNSEIVLSGTGNKVITFAIDSGATEGDDGAEIADSTVLAHTFSLAIVAAITSINGGV